jgi:hypothetical protein
MNFGEYDQKQVQIEMSAIEASWLLEGFELESEHLGPLTQELRDKLVEAGVQMPSHAGDREEYFPPRDMLTP